jgi:alanine dehydrogenase
MPTTRLINQSEVLAVLDMPCALTAVEEIFRLHGLKQVLMPAKTYLDFPAGDLRSMPAYASALGFAAVKNINVHLGNRDIPTIIGTLTLFDPETGFPLAIMDATAITRMRTGAAAGIAVKHLAREDVQVLAIIGAGNQAFTQLEAVLAVRPGIREVVVFDLDDHRAATFASQAAARFDLITKVARSAEEAVTTADVLTTITPAREPVVKASWIKPGTHINAIGADGAGKQELDAAVLKGARIIIDDFEQATHSGEINVPLAQGLIGVEQIAAELGQVVAGLKVGRERADQITLFDSTGLALQDLACAAHVYRAVMKRPAGQEFDFLA